MHKLGPDRFVKKMNVLNEYPCQYPTGLCVTKDANMGTEHFWDLLPSVESKELHSLFTYFLISFLYKCRQIFQRNLRRPQMYL